MDKTVAVKKNSNALIGNKNKNEQVIVFLHIPKAGGSTLHDIILHQYSETRHFFREGLKALDGIRGFSMEEREEFGVIRGHMNFGVHALLSKPCVYFTMLRDPVERIISYYYYAAQRPAHPFYGCASKMGLKDFIITTTENNNGQTRAFVGVADCLALFGEAEVPFGKCGPDILEKAKENLKNFAVVGLTERFDETLILLKRVLGWKQPPLYIKKNVTENKPLKEDIPADVLDLIKKHNELDIELYGYASELFEKRIKEQDASFGMELEYFKQLNDLYQENYRLKDECQTLEQSHQALEQSHQTLEQSKAVQVAKELGRHPMLLKAGNLGYGVMARIFKSLIVK